MRVALSSTLPAFTQSATQSGDLFLITTDTEIFALWGQGFKDVQTLIFACGAEQFASTKGTFPFAHNPGARLFRSAGDAEDECRETDQHGDPYHEPEPCIAQEGGKSFERLVEEDHGSPL